MQEQLITKAICEKAKKLEIEPLFLLICIAAIAESNVNSDHKNDVEERIRKFYFNAIAERMAIQAHLQKRSKKGTMRSAGEQALQKFCFDDLEDYDIDAEDVLRFAKDLESVRYLDIIAIEKVLNDEKELKARFGIRPVPEIVNDLFKNDLFDVTKYISLIAKWEMISNKN